MRNRNKLLFTIGLIAILLAIPLTVVIIRVAQKYLPRARVSPELTSCGVTLTKPNESYDKKTGTYTVDYEIKNNNDFPVEIKGKKYWCRCKEANGSPENFCFGYWPEKEGFGLENCKSEDVTITLEPGESLSQKLEVSQTEESSRRNCGSFQVDFGVDSVTGEGIENPDACFEGVGLSGYFGTGSRGGVDCEIGPPEKYKTCRGMSCVEVEGLGPDQCQTDEHCIQRVCRDNACVEQPGLGTDQCTTDADCAPPPPPPPTPTHKICQNNACVEVEGSGTNECNVNDDCVQKVCQNNACVEVAGTGADQCGTDADCAPTPTPTHNVCQNEACVEVAGEGTNECNVTGDCVQKVCQNNACVEVAGTGADQCTTNKDCAPTPTPTHFVCQDKACVEVSGSGTDDCNVNSDCIQKVCQNEACVEVAGTGADQCSTDSNCREETHNVCQNNACVEVAGSGSNECQTNQECETQTYQTCENQTCVEKEGTLTSTCQVDNDCKREEKVPVTGIDTPTIITTAATAILFILGVLLVF